MVMRSIIVLCGGKSRRMGKDKGSLRINGKPMLLHVLDEIKDVAEEIVLVLRDEEQIENYKEFLNDKNNSIKVVVDKMKDQGPLVGILSGLSVIESDYALVLPCDSPFISKIFVLKMFELARRDDFDAIVPIWDDGHVEPLHSIYKKSSVFVIEDLVKVGKMNVKSLIDCLDVKYVDVEELDITTRSFRNINRVIDI